MLNALNPNLGYADGVALAVALIAGGWLAYDLVWRMPARNAHAQGIISLLLLVIVTWYMLKQFSKRGAYLMKGALLGTLMAGTVFSHIIPSQKQMVAAIQAGMTRTLRLRTARNSARYTTTT